MTRIPPSPQPGPTTAPVQWAISDGLVGYAEAVAVMEQRTEAIAVGQASELVWLVEHPPLYTAGTSAAAAELVAPDRFPVHVAGRGGRYTYHGPGQRVVYVMLDVRRRGGDLRAFVGSLERWIIAVLDRFGVKGEIRTGRVGVWVQRPDKGVGVEEKIAAIGIRVRRWVSFHGLAINVEPDLEHFSGIVPCGIPDHGVTSLAALGRIVSMAEVDMALAEAFAELFGPTLRVPAPPAVPIRPARA